MAESRRSTTHSRVPWPLHHPHRCYYLRLVRLCWFISLAFLLMEVAGVVEARVSRKGCLQKERDALLLFKAAVGDPSGRLSSWRAQVDCCAWTGVVCHNTTGSVRVAELNLQNPIVDQLNWTETALLGELLHPSILSLTHLQNLNLSSNDFESSQIPPLIGSRLHKLRYLDLSYSNFAGTIPPHVGNLTNLRYLDLRSYREFSKVHCSLDWLSGLSSLIYLDMSGLDLSATSHNLLPIVSMLPSLQQLKLYDCNINIPLSVNFHLNLTSLTTLNLGENNFNFSFPNWLWNITSLSSLQLDNSGIGGTLPAEIGNLISLTHLELSSNFLSSPLPDTIWKLEHLAYLDLGHNLLGNSLLAGIMNLSSLSTLYLANCSLTGPIPSEIGNLTLLNTISFRYNSLSGPIPVEIGKLVNLNDLDLSSTSLDGDISELHLSNLTKLKTFLLYDNPFLTIAIDHNWIPLFQLDSISLGSCKLGPRFPAWLRSQQSIMGIQLYNTSIDDNLPEWLWNSSSMLDFLDLSYNKISGTLPKSLESLTRLYHLNLGSNLLEGPIPHFSPNLEFLDLSFNSFSGQLPPTLFTPQLQHLPLSRNQINRNISQISFLDLSYNKISGTLPTSMECLTELFALSLGSNLFEGSIPHLSADLYLLDLSNNAFSGQLPQTLFTPQMSNLFLSHNHINGSIPSNICNSHMLERLNLSNNKIFGKIPQCWQEIQYLYYINLGNNMLSGEIPSSLGNLMGLEYLHLNNNNLKGYLPSSLQNCTRLLVVDFGNNNFSGNIPLWIGQSWQQLRILQLRSNMFNGNIDPQLGYLRDLQIVDLANNNLSGPIPHSFGNFSTMISASAKPLPMFRESSFANENYWESITLVTKGGQLTFSSILYLVKSIDLSNNGLTNEIPKELGYLAGLHTLNLSRNYFRGNIPDSIGRMSSLETLDLSFNNLSGAIPQSLSEINALNHLNLSYNNLSGNIPSGNQLQTLEDATSYIGNLYLCGDLVNKSCFPRNTINMTSKEHVMMSTMLSIYLISALGYFAGMWSVFVLLLFKKKWRYSFFKKVDEIYDKVYVTIKIRLNGIMND